MLSLFLAVTVLQDSAKLPSWSAFPGDAAVARESQHVHDPTVVNVKGTWLCFSTSGDGFSVVRTSKDLKSWTVHGPIFKESPEWLKRRYRHRSIWAPDVLVLGDKVRVYYCASEFGTNKSVIGVAECEKFDPAKPLEGWQDKGLVIESVPDKDTFNAIDPETIVDPSGRYWLYFGSYFAGLYVAELDPTTGRLLHPEKPESIRVAQNTGERGNPLEGAAVCRRGEDYYLFVSYGLAAQGVRSTYRIMVGRSTSPSGPFLDAAGRSMADGGHVEVMKGSSPMFSPGHSDVLQAPDGRWLMPYHFYDARSYWGGGNWGLPRLQIRELLWTADGWPLPGLPVEFPHLAGATKKMQSGRWMVQSDFGEPISLDWKTDGTLVSGKDRGSWKLEGESLTVQLPGASSPLSMLAAYQGTYAVGRDARGHVVRAVRTGR
ncbi:arabinan endo-1,5-alpha-L-arabinosidase [bacterium]|nr:MAG: arabinan endo-1,5-alpha-L-arabinosidase [bacterium]